MSAPMVLAAFDTDTNLLSAVLALRARGIAIDDAYTPCPVHGLSEAMGLPPSRLSWVTFASGALGTALMTYFIYWASAITWPINIGGKPWNSLPAFMPPIFETMVLSAALGTVAAFVVGCRLVPGRAPSPFVAGATDNLFVLAFAPLAPLDTAAAVTAWLAPFEVRRVEVRMSNDT